MMNNHRQQKDQRQLRDALGCFPTGVAIATTLGAQRVPVGMTINSFCSVSLSPALISFCVDKSAASYNDFFTCPGFTLSILGEQQRQIAEQFAQRGAEKFSSLDNANYPGFAPPIPQANAVFECTIYRRLTLGDHLMLVGKVVDFHSHDQPPLTFFRGQFRQLLNHLPQQSQHQYQHHQGKPEATASAAA